LLNGGPRHAFELHDIRRAQRKGGPFVRHFSRFLFSLALSIATLTLGGCGVVDWLVGNNINVNGAKPTVSMERAPLRGYAKLEWLTGSENYFDQADLVAELDPAYTCPNSYTLAQCLAKALDNFYWNVNGKSDEQRKLRRNAVQGRLIAASNSACREFTQHLNSYQSYTNFVLGTAAVGAGAAGAIVSPAVAAKALAGSAAAITGTKAEFNSDVFQKEFVSTITRGIDKRRRDF